MYTIGIDIGGTNLKVGLIEDGRIIDKIILPSNTFDIIRQLISTTFELLEKNKIEQRLVTGVGVACPGIIDEGKIMSSANLVIDCDLQTILSQELNMPVVVKNDADMATLAENKLGSGENVPNMVMLTIGTGIGSGIIIDSKIYEGVGGAGELGHLIWQRNGKPCNCGRNGCAEKYLSANALSQRALELMETMPNTIQINDGQVYASSLVQAEQSGDTCAKIIIDDYVDEFADYLTGICNAFRPNKIVIGGGIINAPTIIDRIAKACRVKYYGYKKSKAVDIVPATLGNDAGMMASYVIFNENN